MDLVQTLTHKTVCNFVPLPLYLIPYREPLCSTYKIINIYYNTVLPLACYIFFSFFSSWEKGGRSRLKTRAQGRLRPGESLTTTTSSSYTRENSLITPHWFIFFFLSRPTSTYIPEGWGNSTYLLLAGTPSSPELFPSMWVLCADIIAAGPSIIHTQ